MTDFKAGDAVTVLGDAYNPEYTGAVLHGPDEYGDYLVVGPDGETETVNVEILGPRRAEDETHWAYAALRAQDRALTAQINEAVAWGKQMEAERDEALARLREAGLL